MRFIFIVHFLLTTISPSIAEPHLRVGVSIPLSGPTAEYGVAIRNGIELARQERAGLETVAFHFSDNRYDPKTAITGYRKLRTANSIQLLYLWGDAVSTAVAPIAEKDRVPTIAVLTNPEPVVGMRYVIRFANSYHQYAEALLQELRKKQHKRIGMIIAEGPYYMNMLDGLRSQLREDETIEVLDTYRYEDHDFRMSIQKLRRRRFDTLGVFLMPGQVSTFFRQLSQANISLPTFGSDTFASTTEAEQAQGAMTGGAYAYHDVGNDFRRKYLEAFGNDVQLMYAANAYEFAKTLTRLPPYSSRAADSLMHAFRSLGKRQSPLGPYAYSETERDGAHFSFPIVMKTVPPLNGKREGDIRARARMSQE